jgi:hypothetical protein
MRKTPIFYFILLLLLAIGWYLNQAKPSKAIDNNSFTNRIDNLVYTKHARCRMDCRNISEEEIREIIRIGKINSKKSDPTDRPCPTIAMEGYSSSDQQHIRLILADCEKSLKLVTCIDLENDHSCSCN